jgi:hypothetical protein
MVAPNLTASLSASGVGLEAQSTLHGGTSVPVGFVTVTYPMSPLPMANARDASLGPPYRGLSAIEMLRQLSFPLPAGFGAAETFYRTLERKLNSGEGTLLGQAKTDAVGDCVVGYYETRTQLVAHVRTEVLG